MASVNVLTLKELSMYLRLPEEKIKKEVVQGRIPGRRIENDWRFLKRAINDWLRSHDSRTILVHQAGALSDDDTLKELRSISQPQASGIRTGRNCLTQCIKRDTSPIYNNYSGMTKIPV